ncbi:MAG: endonuclease/exonuclease/phosphatase family protein [Verrucomicrobiales bacterium]|nr:endonuclease/exonuclease/phosphatase family protein [Verrucomicrobiales bacterium]
MRAVPKPLPSSSGESITVLTYNRGQHMGQSLQPFKNLTHPDIIALQEAPGRASRYLGAEGYEAFVETESIGEFTVLSKYPILSSELINLPSGPQILPTAARFEIDFEGQRIALYVVHVVSPRDVLFYYRRGAFLYGILGLPGTSWGKKKEQNQVVWDQRIQEARELRDLIEKDPLPSLLVGDLNAPSGGAIHRIFRKTLTDAHRENGSGFGYTFPGVTRNPLSRGGPWMRIDYLFCDDDWEPVWCLTEKERKSQHRAVTAQFRLLTPSN